LAVPLICGQEIIGVLESTNKIEGMFNQSDLELLEALANSAASAIQNARLFDQLQAGRERLRRLTNQVVSAQEEERQRLSYELHDEAGQILTALKIRLGYTLDNLPVEAEAYREHLNESLSMADMTMERLRALARDLRPPALDAAGLNPTLEGLCREFASWTELSINYAGTEVNALSDPVKITLYRFLQEALTNIAKHAQAGQVSVNLREDTRSVNLEVQDDGKGFDKQILLDLSSRPKGIGVLGMQERLELLGGRLEIETTPGLGTSLTAHIPLEGI
jgi:signal transduction histidine kinase